MKKLYKVSAKYSGELFIAEATIIKETEKMYFIEYEDVYDVRTAFDFIHRLHKDRPDTYLTKEDAIKAFEDRCNFKIKRSEEAIENQKTHLKKLEKLKESK